MLGPNRPHFKSDTADQIVKTCDETLSIIIEIKDKITSLEDFP